jgi:gliding motility-associated-like protein
MRIFSSRYLFSALFIVILTNSLFSQIGNWIPRASFGGTVRQYAVGFSINNKGYIGTGWDLGAGYRDDFWEYDPATNSWTQKAAFAGGQRIFAVGFSIGSRGYVGTGQDFGGRRKDFWEYNPISNTWAQKANFGGTARSRAVGFSVDSKGYIGTGYEDAGNVYFSDFWEYDPVNNFWNKKANFGGGSRREAVGFSIGNKGYIGTGFDGSQYKKDFWQFNPSNNSWTQKASLGTAQWLAVGFSIGRKGYIGVGYGAANPLKEFWEYDTLTNSWKRNRDFDGNARFAAVGFSIGLRGYLGTGFDINNQKMRDFWEFQPPYIVTGSLGFTRLCINSSGNTTIDVIYTKSITFLPGNVFTAQLSDSSGNFDSPTNIGSRTDTAGGTIKSIIPSNVIHGSKYRIRVVSSKPSFIGSDNGRNLIINHNPLPIMNINDSIQCLNNNKFEFLNASTVAFGKVVKSKWYFGDNDTSSGQKTTHSYLHDGNFTIKMRAVSDSGSADSVNRIVIVLPVPNSSFNPGDTIQCFGGNKFTFINTSTIKSGTLSYKWYPGTGDSSVTKDYSYSYPKEGLFKIKLVATSAKGCSDTSSHIIRVDSTILARFEMTDTVECARAPFFFKNTTTGSPDFLWTFGEGLPYRGRDAVHAFTKDSIYEVKLLAFTPSTQCYDSLIRRVHIIPSPNPAFSVNEIVQNQIGNVFVFSNQTTVKSGGYTSQWVFGDGNSSTQQSPSHSYLTTDSFLVNLFITNDLGCRDSVMKWVYVFNTLLNADFYVQNVCVGDLTQFKNTSSVKYDSIGSYLWNFGENSSVITGQDPMYKYSGTGVFLVKMICITVLGYRDSVSYTVTVLSSPPLEIELSPSPPFILGDVTTLTANGVYDSIMWGGGEQTSSIDVSVTGTYKVRIVDENGCDSVLSVFVEFLDYPGFTPPNIITPNGDGINDLWKVEKPERYAPSQLNIFNRWGELVFKAEPNILQWDGKKNNSYVAPGTYYFVLYGNEFEMSGTITVIY